MKKKYAVRIPIGFFNQRIQKITTICVPNLRWQPKTVYFYVITNKNVSHFKRIVIPAILLKRAHKQTREYNKNAIILIIKKKVYTLCILETGYCTTVCSFYGGHLENINWMYPLLRHT